MLKIGCFSGRIQNVPKSVGGTLGPDGKMRTGEVTSNCLNPTGASPPAVAETTGGQQDERTAALGFEFGK